MTFFILSGLDACFDGSDEGEVSEGDVVGVEATAYGFMLFFAVKVGCESPFYAFGDVARIAVFGYVAGDFVVDDIGLPASAE